MIKLLSHSNDYVWKKAVMVIQKFYSISPQSYENMDALMKTALCDKIPAVMGASLNYFLDWVKVNP